MKPSHTLLAAALTLGLAACGNDRDTDATAPGMTGAETTTPADGTAGMTPMDSVGAPGTGMTGAAMPADADRTALLMVEEVDRHEIAAAEDALAKNVEGDVRAYAETLRDDHTRNLEATRRLMGGTGSTQGAGAMGGTGTAGSGGTPTDTGGTTSPATASGTQGQSTAGAGMDGMAHAGGDSAQLAAMRQKHEAERQRLSELEGEAFATAWVDAMVRGHEEALATLDNELIPGATDAGVGEHLRQTRSAIARHLETARGLQSGNR